MKMDWKKTGRAIRDNSERLFAHAIYIALLAVLWPHTKWMFQQFEPEGNEFTAGAAAFVFEAAIYVLTRKLAKHIEQVPNVKKWLVRNKWNLAWARRIQLRYANAYTVGLFVSIAISSVANWAHAVEFGQDVAIYAKYAVDPLVLSVGFGGVLSFVSLLFARVLADVQDAEPEANEEESDLRRTFREQGRVLKQTEARLAETEARLLQAEDAAKLILELSAEDKARRIVAAQQIVTQLPFAVPRTALAALTDTSQSYVSEVLKGSNGHG